MKKEKKLLLDNNSAKRAIVIVIALILLVFSGFQIAKIYLEENAAKNEQKDLISIIADVDGSIDSGNNEEAITLTGKSFSELKAINSDFIGWLSFNSGLINQPVVLTGDNEYYLNKSFFKKNSSMGTAFLDASQTTASRNMTIYGHLVYNNNSLMFSPLHKLIDQANYQANRYFSFTTATEVRNYEVAIVFYYHLEEDMAIPYYVGNLTDDQFNQYVELAGAKEFYDTGVEFSTGDKLITLQTCVKNKDELRLIIIGKEISRTPIN